MFFIRLRKGAKWVFIALVFAFAFSFVFAGVGSGGSTGDIVQQLLGMRGSDPIDSAEKETRDNPRSINAWTRLAQLYDGEDRRDEALKAYNKILDLSPRDQGALSSLSNLWGDITVERWGKYSEVQQELEIMTDPGGATSKIQEWIGTEPLRSTYQNTLMTQASETYDSYQSAAESWEKTTERWVKAIPIASQRAQGYLSLGQAAASAGHTAKAIKSYKEFLRLAPNSPYASAVKKTIKDLQEES